jgi:hypothetical protein
VKYAIYEQRRTIKMCQECDEDYFYYVGRYNEKALDADLMANILYEYTTNEDGIINLFMTDYWQNQHTYDWNAQEFKKIFSEELEFGGD